MMDQNPMYWPIENGDEAKQKNARLA